MDTSEAIIEPFRGVTWVVHILPPEFREEAVRQVIERGHSVVDVASRLGVSSHSLYKWVKDAKPSKSEQRSDELLESKKEAQKLRAELRRAEEERVILKKAAVDSTGECNIIQSTRIKGDVARDANGTTWIVCITERKHVVAMEEWRVA